MKTKIYIIGHKSFIQKNLYNFFKKKKLSVKKITFQSIIKSKKKISNSILINCSTNKNFYNKKYNIKYDRNFLISKIFKNKNNQFYLISSRQVYEAKLNLTEDSKLKPISLYGKNCLRSEKNCKMILGDSLNILRVSNVIGLEKRPKNFRQSLMSTLIKGIKKNKVVLDKNSHFLKDLLPINILLKYFYILVKKQSKNLILNVGSGHSMTLENLYKIMNKKKKSKVNFTNNLKNFDNNYSYKIKKLYALTKYKINKKEFIKEIYNIKNQYGL